MNRELFYTLAKVAIQRKLAWEWKDLAMPAAAAGIGALAAPAAIPGAILGGMAGFGLNRLSTGNWVTPDKAAPAAPATQQPTGGQAAPAPATLPAQMKDGGNTAVGNAIKNAPVKNNPYAVDWANPVGK